MKHRVEGYGIEAPASISRRPYRIRQGGLNVYHVANTAAHYSDRPTVSRRDNETGRGPQHRDFDKGLASVWSTIEESGV